MNSRSFSICSTDFLSPRWTKYVVSQDAAGNAVLSRPYYELAVLSTLNERLKSGHVTVTGSHRWSDFEDYLIPKTIWESERAQHYAALHLPIDVEAFLRYLNELLTSVIAQVEQRVPNNRALTIDAERGTFRLAAVKGEEPPETVKQLKDLIESRLPRVDLVDILIDLDNETDFLRHFLHEGSGSSRLTPAKRRRNVLAALIAIGCNLGPHRMAVASPGINAHEISQIADWYFTEEALKAASIDLVNYASRQPLSRLWGQGNTCSADGMRFYVPVHILAADYSPVLQDRGVTLFAHTADNFLRLHQQPIPCRLREATFSLDGLLEHDTELDPRVCYTDTHCYTEVVMATAALLGFELAPRIRDIKDQTLYKIDREQRYPHLDPILTGTVRAHLIRRSWDEVVRVMASLRMRTVSASLVLNRLGSYARQNSIYQALAEIGKAYKTAFLLRWLDVVNTRPGAHAASGRGGGCQTRVTWTSSKEKALMS
jgi:TnpA family transposase